MAMMLTPRQREVAELLAKGKSPQKVARTLGISPRTVEHHIQHAAERIDLPGPPRIRVVLFVVQLEDAEDAA